MKGDYQELVDEISALLGAPATLENRDFGLVAFGAHDSDDDTAMDPVRTRSILTRRSTPAVRAWFEGFGIARATGPVRIPAAPEAGVFRDRICLPVRHRGVVLGYVWLLDADPRPTSDQLAAAMDVAARIGGSSPTRHGRAPTCPGSSARCSRRGGDGSATWRWRRCTRRWVRTRTGCTPWCA